MRSFVLSACLPFVLLVTVACDVPRRPPEGIPPATIPPIAAADLPLDEQKPLCVRFWGEARYRSFGYDHIVHLSSSCRRTASCRVSTSVNPAVVVVAVPPGEQIEVVTLRSSATPEFTPNVQCSRGTL